MRADTLHERFAQSLSEYSLEFDEAMQYLIKEQMIVEYNKSNEQKEENIQNIEKQLGEVDKKLERLEERFVLEEIRSWNVLKNEGFQAIKKEGTAI